VIHNRSGPLASLGDLTLGDESEASTRGHVAHDAARPSAVRNGLWNAAATVVGGLAGLAGSILVVRSLTPEAYGSFSYYLWLTGTLAILGTLSFPEGLTKVTSELRGQRLYLQANSLARCVIASLLAVNLVIGLGVLVWSLESAQPQR